MLDSFKYRRKKKPPAGYSSKSNLSYYSPQGGEEIKVELNKLIDGSKVRLCFDSFKLSVQPATLWVRLDQSWKWLMENDVDKEKWKALREVYEITKDGRYVRIQKRLMATPLKEGTLIEEDSRVDDYSLKVDWKGTLQKYIEIEEKSLPPLELTGLRLSSDDLESMSIYLGGLDEKIATIYLNAHGFKVIKNEELAKALKKKRGEGN